MNILSKVNSDVKKTANMTLIYANAGVGKSTLISQIPDVLVLDIEDSTKKLEVERLGSDAIPNFDSLVSVTTELLESTHKYKAIAIDSLTALETYIQKKVCEENGKVDSVDLIPYGQGYALTVEKLDGYLKLLKRIQNEKQIDIWFTGHAVVKKFNDPQLLNTFDRYVVQGNEKFMAKIIQNCDNVFFGRFEVNLVKDQAGKSKGVSEGERVMYTSFRPAFDAKNRLNLPFELKMDYATYAKACDENQPKGADAIISDINGLLVKVKEVNLELYKMIAGEKLQAAGKDVVKLNRIKSRLLESTTTI